jgi:hypothetical protein
MSLIKQLVSQSRMDILSMPKGLHIKSGETALLQACAGRPDYVLAQFNRFTHPESHGWHEYPCADWMVKVRVEDPWAPLISMLHDEVVMGPFDRSIPQAATADDGPPAPCVVGNQAGWYP